MTSSFCDISAATVAPVNSADPIQLLLTGGKAHAVKKVLVWIVDCCAGYGLVDFPQDDNCPVITAYEDRKAAYMLGVQRLATQLDGFIVQKSLPGTCIPPDEIAHKLKTVDTSDSTFDFLVKHVAGKTFEDNQTRFEQESAAKDAKRNSRPTKRGTNKGYNPRAHNEGYQERRPEKDGTAGSYSCRPKLPSDVWIPLRNAFVQPFGNAVNAVLQAKLKQAVDERHARERARHQARVEEPEDFEEDQEEEDTPIVTKTLSLQPGRKIGKRAAGKLNLADLGISHQSFTGDR